MRRKNMFKSNFNRAVGVMIISGCLMACSSIEHRSERVAKQTLPTASKLHYASKYWSNSTDKGSKNQAIKLLLAKSDNYIFVSDSVGNVKAVVQQTGKQFWQAKIKKNITAGPSADSKVVVLATEDGEVVALDSSNGNVIWQQKVSSEVIAAPLVTQDKVYVHALDGGIFALDTATGKEIWQYSSIAPSLILRRSSGPVIYENLLIVGTASGKLLGIDKNTGGLEWSEDVSNPKGKSETQRMNDVSADPVVDNGKIYAVSYQGKLAAIDLATRTRIFDKDLSSFSGLSISKGKIYVSTADGAIYALDQATGNTIWQQSALQGRWLTKPVVFKDYILVGDDDGWLHWISRENGNLVNRYQVDGSGIVAPPIAHDDMIFVLGQGGKFISLKIN